MKTLQEKYNAILEGNFSKAQFVRDARMELPNLITQFNGFKDTTAILKNRGMIFEAKKEKTKEYDQPTPGYSIEALERAVDYEIEGMGLQSQETISEKDYLKAKTKAEKNLDKNPNHYLDLLSGESNKVDKHDKYVEVKKNNHVDTFNGMKKAELKESIVEKAMAKGYTKEQVEAALSRLKEKKGTDHDGDGDIDGDDYMAAKDKAIKKAMGKDVDEDQEGDHNFYDNKEKAKQIIQIAKDAINLMDEQPGTSVKDAIEAVMEFKEDKEKQLKEAIKSIIKKTLNEDVINEAATSRLSQKIEEFGGYNGAQGVINSLEFAKDLVKSWLEEFKFKNWTKTRDRGIEVTDVMRKKRASEVAEMLCDHTTWRTHGRSLKIEDLKDVLVIERIDDDTKLADIVYRIKTIIRLILDGSTVYKLFFTDDLQLTKTFTISSGNNNPVPHPLAQKRPAQKAIDVVDINVQCPKCKKKHKVSGYLDIDSQTIKKAKLPTNNNIKENDVLVCDNCNFTLDLKPIKNQVESQSKRKVTFK